MDCTSANPPGQRIAWSFYVIGLIYDLVTIGISTVYLWNYSVTQARMGRFLQRLFFEGLGYFAFLSGVNIVNIIFFRSANTAIQASGVTLGYVVTFVMTQRILIHQRETAAKFASHVKTATTDPSQGRQPEQGEHPSASRILQEIEDDFDYIKSSAIFGSDAHGSVLSRTGNTSEQTPDGVLPTESRQIEDIEMRSNAHVIIEQIPLENDRRPDKRPQKSGRAKTKKRQGPDNA